MEIVYFKSLEIFPVIPSTTNSKLQKSIFAQNYPK
jgi:hypothetical protein